MQKYRGKWEESFDCNLRATELDPKDEASWWNLGIAATVLGRWVVARRAWQNCDVVIPPGDGPIEMQLGSFPYDSSSRARAKSYGGPPDRPGASDSDQRAAPRVRPSLG